MEERLRVVLYSFGFKYGMPADTNMVWDVRFLPNPYWVEELRAKTGQAVEVADYVLESEATRSFIAHLEPLLAFLVEQYRVASRPQLRIAIGCTGGRHRSVVVTERIARLLAGLPVELIVFHRDIERDGRVAE